MIIDFHNFFQNNNIIGTKNCIQRFCSFKQKPDCFIKTVNVESSDNYDGITISQKNFGTIQKSGESAKLFTITNKNGASVDLSTFGATVVSIKVPDKDGKLKDVVQGYNSVTPYETCPVGHAGGTIGPCANKISNGEFKIGNRVYKLETNKDNGKSHSHGGSDGFDVKNWDAKTLNDGVEFTYHKTDMESGYPGNVDVKVTYKFDNNSNLHIIYDAQTDKDTLVNLTNHTYFNLDGSENAYENSVLEHVAELPNSSKITENNEIAIPTGKFLDVKNTPFDFSKPHAIGDYINEPNEQLKLGSGYDQNYCIDNYDGKNMIEIARVTSAKTGIKLAVSTNLPGFQFYTSNHLGKSAQPEGKDGLRYEKRSALCIEPQIYPNAINTKEFKDKGILKKGQNYHKEIIYSFSSQK